MQPHNVERCSKCGKSELSVFYYVDLKPVCEICKMKMDPPKMLLVKINGLTSRSLYNATHRCFEKKKSIEEFTDCGWFVRRIKEKGGNKYYHLEYHGKLKCPRCEEYKFPFGFYTCIRAKECIGQAGQR